MAELQRKSAGDVVVDYIVGQITKGELKTGDKLPNERELSTKLNVSRVSLREAISSLTVAGILEPKQGSGTFVGSFQPQRMAQTAYLFTLLDGATLSEVLNTRRALEAEAAWQAAQKATGEQKKAIAAALKKAEGKFNGETDLEFHLAVAQAGGNLFLEKLLETVEHCGQSLWSHSGTPAADGGISLDYYRRVAKAIDGGDVNEAYTAMYEYGAWVAQYGDL